MSLINEALKKAQKIRTGEPLGTIPPMPGDSRVTKRAQPRSAQQLLVLASGGLVLVVLSVVITFWLVNRAPAEKSAVKPAAPKSPATETAVAPIIVPPVIKTPPVVVETSAGKSTVVTKATAEPPATTKAAPVVSTPPATPPQATPAPTPAPPRTEPVAVAPETRPPVQETSTPAPVAATEPATPVKTDERVHQFIDAIKVGGIRSSGGDSRVLMNDRVFRVNDIVERNFGLRLSKVESDALTFTDGNGAVYVKHF